MRPQELPLRGIQADAGDGLVSLPRLFQVDDEGDLLHMGPELLEHRRRSLDSIPDLGLYGR